MTKATDHPIQEDQVSSPFEVVGLIPAAGLAARIAPLPCSKELFPIGFWRDSVLGRLKPKPVCLYLLESMRSSGIQKAYIVLRPGKWDIPAYLGNGAAVGMSIAYLLMQQPFGAPFTIDEAYHFLDGANIAFGFPDILFKGEGVYQELNQRLIETEADVVVGLFPVRSGQRADMVDAVGDGLVKRILIKPETTDLKYAWITAVWRPTFSAFMHGYLQNLLRKGNQNLASEQYVGDVLQAAIDQNLTVQSVIFPNRYFYDIGTPEGMLEAMSVYGKVIEDSK
jgi:glucose-1-phosphate thymidylyltransferase